MPESIANPSTNSPKHDPIAAILVNAPHWLGLFIASAYASGFLATSIFFDRFGIQSAGEDFFRSKYVYVGIMFLLFPICNILPAGLLVCQLNELRKSQKSATGIGKGHKVFRWSSALAVMNLCSVLYIYILFMPRYVDPMKGLWLFLLISATYLLPRLSNSIDEIRWRLEHRERHSKLWIIIRRSDRLDILRRIGALYLKCVGNIDSWSLFHDEPFYKWLRAGRLRWLVRASWFFRWVIMLLAIVALDVILFQGYWKKSLQLFPWGQSSFGVFFYVVFLFLIAYTLWRSNTHIKKLGDRISDRSKNERRLLAACVSLLFYFCAVIAFAVRVFPLIPESKGGGNYEQSPLLTLHLKPPVAGAILSPADKAFRASLEVPDDFILIEQTSRSLFVARKTAAGGPSEWRHMLALPPITEVNLDSLESIDHGFERISGNAAPAH